jgi:hypothetical protein
MNSALIFQYFLASLIHNEGIALLPNDTRPSRRRWPAKSGQFHCCGMDETDQQTQISTCSFFAILTILSGPLASVPHPPAPRAQAATHEGHADSHYWEPMRLPGALCMDSAYVPAFFDAVLSKFPIHAKIFRKLAEGSLCALARIRG